MTGKEAIKPEDIKITFSRSANLRDMLITGSLQRDKKTKEANFGVDPDVKHAHI